MAFGLGDAAARLEAAVERLAAAASRPRSSISEEEVAELGRRLDSTLARLRLALAREESEGEMEAEPESEDLSLDAAGDEEGGEEAGQAKGAAGPEPEDAPQRRTEPQNRQEV